MNASTNTSSVRLIKSTDDNKCWFQELSWKDLTINTLKSKFAPDGAEFLPAKVLRGKDVIWAFSKGAAASMAFLREYGDEPIIALTTKNSVLDVIFLADIGKEEVVRVKGREVKIPARPFTEVALCKRAISEDLGRDAVYSNEESVALKAHDQQVNAARVHADQEERNANLREQEEARRRRAAEQATKIEKIMARKEVSCYTKDGGKPRRGKPVVGNEWECLKNGMFCISVSSYDEKTGEHGELFECFRVRKDGARCSKQSAEAVQMEPIVAAKAAELEAEDVRQIEVAGKIRMVPIYIGVKPSEVPLSIPFAVEQDKVLTVYQRNSAGKLGTMGVVRQQSAAA